MEFFKGLYFQNTHTSESEFFYNVDRISVGRLLEYIELSLSSAITIAHSIHSMINLVNRLKDVAIRLDNPTLYD